MNKEQKQEASIPIQARINIANLAELLLLWESQGIFIKTMSQLVGWSIELLCQELKDSGKMPQQIDNVNEANKVLLVRGLYQKSLKDRSMKKISMAMGFDSLRTEGTDPKSYAPRQYSMMHPANQIQPSMSQVVSKGKIKELTDQAVKVYDDLMRKEAKDLATAAIQQMTRDGLVAHSASDEMKSDIIEPADMVEGMSREQIEDERIRKDAVIRASENAPVDLEWLKSHGVK